MYFPYAIQYSSLIILLLSLQDATTVIHSKMYFCNATHAKLSH